MARRGALGLSELARHGFSELSAARARLEALGLSAEVFSHAGDPDAALAAWQQLAEAAPTEIQAIGADPAARTNLISLLGASSGLADFFRRQPQQLSRVLDSPSAPASRAEMVARLNAAVGESIGEQAATSLRIAYRVELSRLALYDSSHARPIDIVDQVARALADLADAALEVALACARREWQLPEEVAPLAIIAMGKAGARELNYLSDVDVIYVTQAPDSDRVDEVVQAATTLAQATQRTIMEFGLEPGLWEVDANLRPEGRDGPLVRTLDSHVAYYQRWAKDWEFQALIKARPMAGSLELGREYLRALEPMVWRASSREGFVEQVQRMRERVTHNIPHDEVDVQLKLGPGGLRDVEFTIQLLQLVHGGMDDEVRVPDTLGALAALAKNGYVGREEAAEFDRAYRFLRTLEHRLQLRQLRRTHLMPRDDQALRVLARSTHLAEGADALVEAWRRVQRQVRTLHERLFYRPLLQAVAGLAAEGGVELTSAQAADRLRATGFVDPEGAMGHITALTQGVSRRAAIQRHLLPVVLRWLAEGTDPDRGLLAFRRLSDDLGESPWFLRMLRDSSGATSNLTRVLGTSGFAGALLERVPEGAGWLDDGDELRPRPAAQLAEEIDAIARRYRQQSQSAQNALRQLRRRELLRLSMGSIIGAIDTGELQVALGDVTEKYLEGAWKIAAPDFPGIECALVAMGRFGGNELGFASDADVLYVVRDAGAGDQTVARGEALVRKIVELTSDPLFPFELDAGLRPEGRNGPLVRSLDAYRNYYQRWALGWEAQALLRARDIVGDASLRTDFMELANTVRYPEEFPEDAAREIRRIKARVEAERLPQGADSHRHVKLGRGSLSDVEWLVQLLQLQHGGTITSVRRADTLGALSALVAEGVLPEEDGQLLGESWQLCSNLRNALTLSGRPSDVLPSDRRALEQAARLMGYPPHSASALEEFYLRTTRLARTVFEHHFFPGA
ncbi:bifunctional [glutamine synthetase] adenylyltransferase/[glutamine synthetase]-adenylyl-L-tyrosine phosphorylase [Pontimonas sp.]|uniref:bifunctional [glutamine synthetase] adenylyltransferase/[glutamine synthetase]-adenylyl-L-tyrosine phosphorylase n=1 Tax=Pontimonas sp. TaxID=2304492 RepID=UPI00286FE399|nr:bifunctional [glutamine synthetase] adenylyltransferase/[glutamine synthetase]-adenylyl-L-tyrosine phosphorylase [Pontimonas sp.]MDR9396984.1 bifunctional [glutamine synthetase] adenylyltransferase/[glutamine synthetase]-adenylyl-L-tyrosine phosphorylase [Pontimonas sp.]MDR9434637.1 bifunctional [glutamine synthetase] adenylyltransferase/[glutamine synthetase]-adenylyl-L-tyrosine phosphorylase [Pontimonas sp.]